MSELIPCQFGVSTDFCEGQLLLVNKPSGWTSFDVVKKLRNMLKKQFQYKKIKIGHAGTLDPLATGLLIVCTGKYTKKIELIQQQQKTYTGTITLGATTPSFDLETPIDKTFSITHISEDAIKRTAKKMEGESMQVPPVFSALKHNGKRLYDYARNKEEIEIKARKIMIHSFKIIEYISPDVYFEICCSKGTYIRSIANDFGLFLNSGAYLSSLCRTQIGNYSIQDALTLEEIEKAISLS